MFCVRNQLKYIICPSYPVTMTETPSTVNEITGCESQGTNFSIFPSSTRVRCAFRWVTQVTGCGDALHCRGSLWYESI